MHKSNWDDLKFVLAVAEKGSVNAAAKALKVNHATVLRRIAAFEEAQGQPVFDRSSQGYAVLPGKMALIGAARDAAAAIGRVEQMARGAKDSVFTRVHLTSTDSLCTYLIPRLLPALKGSDVALDVSANNLHSDMGRLSAEIAVRPTQRLPGDLDGAQVAELGFAAFGPAGAGPTPWLGLSGPLARVAAADWMAATGLDRQIAGAADSFLTLREMVAQGAGRAIMPTFLGLGDPRLVRLDTGMPGFRVPIWVASHADLADLPRLARIRRQLGQAIRAEADWLAGDVPPPFSG